MGSADILFRGRDVGRTANLRGLGAKIASVEFILTDSVSLITVIDMVVRDWLVAVVCRTFRNADS